MPIPTPFPPVAPPRFDAGSMPGLSLSRGTQTLHLSETAGWVVLPGVEGLDDPPRSLIEVEPALWDGSLHIAARYQAREIFLPLHYADASTAGLRGVLRGLASLLDAKRGAVTLEVAHADGTRRSIDGALSAPFAKELAEGEGALWRRIGLALRCGDPLFSGEQQTLSFQMGGLVPGFLAAAQFLPVRLADAQVIGAITVDNHGDADAWPVWELTGPCDTATVTLDSTAWSLVDPLAPGETIVVDARRGAFHPVTIGGVSAWGHLAPGAQLGALAPGPNHVSAVVAGAESATRLTVSWRERWLTAW